MSEMLKTTPAMCKKCKYSLVNGQFKNDTTCAYIEYKRQSRGCPVGWCDKYEEKRKGRSKRR